MKAANSDRTVEATDTVLTFGELLVNALQPDGINGTRGTPIHGTKLPIGVRLKAAELFAGQANLKIGDLRRACQVSYKTAWRMRCILRDLSDVVAEKQYPMR